jgi:outer membrane protein OmpA-like peptidoglycan-associated protein/flagellar hook assembly protein FlgD
MMQPVIDDLRGAVSWSVDIVDGSGSVVWNKSIAEFEPLPWEGLAADGEPVPEGSYWVRMTVRYDNGNALERLSDPILLDRTAPKASVAKSTAAFSPDGDGKLDTIRFRVAEATDEDDWRAEIVSQSEGSAVRSVSWVGLPEDFEWDGLDDQGLLAPEGWYLYRLYSADEAGNEFAMTSQAFVLDVRETPSEILALQSGFSPNGDGYLDAMPFELDLPVKDGVSSWSLRVRSASGGTIRTVEGRDSAPAFKNFSWDGADDAERPAPDGLYTLTLSARYYKGNETEAISEAFRLDTTPPALRLSLSPLPFSPDGDGANDVLAIGLEVLDASDIELWDASIVDRDGAPFAYFGGAGSPPSELGWDGLSIAGELVLSAEDYAIRATARDAYGNEASADGVVPVDILVFKEGDRYRIQVPGIYFAPYSVEFPFSRSEGNWETLRRLSEVLQKFSDYSFLIEGNAVRVFWDDPVKGAEEERQVLVPLSKARAERVRTILSGLGIATSRMTTVGLGGSAPIVPHGDLDNRWKNRRVDFVLARR